MSKNRSLLLVALAYVLAVGAGVLWLVVGPDTGRVWLDALIADLVATMVIFGFSRVYKNSSFYDAYWSVIPPLLAVYWWIERAPEADAARFALLMVVLVLWAVRLTANWIYGWAGLHHEDFRYAPLKDGAGRWEPVSDLMGIHVFPTIQVFAAMLPVYVVTRYDGSLNWLDVVALVVGLGAVAIETVADVQMHRFARTKQPGQVMDQGLWAWSRHPNYFGELSFWISMALFGLAAEPTAWWALIGLVGMTAMFLGASIPMMEKRSLERRPDYRRVIDTVPMLIPRPPRKQREPSAG
jgi:steroid 5-alpha reductase family enzyme